MKFKIGLVGAGQIATESHLPVWKSLKNVEVVAICDAKIPLAKEFASRFGIRNVYNNFTDMLGQERPDIIDICTPPFTHAPLSIQAMEYGCHVLVEKPMATSINEADRMIDSSKKHDVRFCVVHQNLYNTAVLKAKYMVESGTLGNLLHVDVRTFESKDSKICLNQNHWCHSLPGGIFFEILPHPIYLLQSFLKNARPIYVMGRKLGNNKWMKNDEVRVLFESENGLGSLVSSCNSVIHGDTLDILGSKNSLKVDLWGRTLITSGAHTQSPLSVGMSNLHLSLQLFKVLGSTASTFARTILGKAQAHYAFISKFIDSIAKNTDPPTTAQEGRETVRLVELICERLK
jgi:predicted dehydrogenase